MWKGENSGATRFLQSAVTISVISTGPTLQYRGGWRFPSHNKIHDTHTLLVPDPELEKETICSHEKNTFKRKKKNTTQIRKELAQKMLILRS